MTLPHGTILGIDINDHQTHPQSNFNMARKLVEDEFAVMGANGHLLLTSSFTGSVSACAVLVKGRSQSGWKFWIVNEPANPFHGQLIEEVRNHNNG